MPLAPTRTILAPAPLPKFAGQEKVDAAAKAGGFDSWIAELKAKYNYALNPELPVMSAWRTVTPINTPVWALERNPFYWGVDTEGNQLPYIDKIQLSLAENLEVANLRAIAGEYDEMGRHMDVAKLPVFLASYPITPASDILHELSKHKNFGVRTMQAEDEIAAAGAALGSAFAGHLAVTTTSGPGVDLKAETIGLAISLELPMILVDIQRGGPSTGLPTKTEAADLLMAFYGRHGESPLPVLAAKSPSDCFFVAIEAARIAIKYRTPVILLSDGYLANGTEPWRLPDVASLPDISTTFATAPSSTASSRSWTRRT